jgi:hypothetical protein
MITWPADTLAVSRQSAMSLSVVANARNQIVGVASQLTVDRLRGDEKLDPGTILTQPDPDQTWPTTIGQTVDDLVFYGESYWLVLRRDSEGFPSRARRLPYGAVAPVLDPDWAKYTRVRAWQVAGGEYPPQDLIHFGMPGNGVLRDSAGTLIDALQLTAAAGRFATVPLPAGVLTNEGQEVGPADAKQIVEDFDTARAAGDTAFLQSMKYERTALNSADLQLVEALAATDTRLARIMNVPVSMVGASPTGGAHAMVYANVVASFVMLIQTAIAPYLRGIEETFSTQGVTPRGQRVAFDTADWLRFAQVAMPSPGLETPPLPQGETQ